MKKFFLTLAVAATMVACNQQGNNETPAQDTIPQKALVPSGVPTAPVQNLENTPTTVSPEGQNNNTNVPVLKMEEGKPLDLSQLMGGQKKTMGQAAAEKIDSIQKLAESGDADYEYFYGACFNEGWGVEVDFAQALKWYKKAADQNQKFSYNAIGNIYRTGSGVQADPKLAYEWFRKGADVKDPQAMLNLGNCYYYGMGAEKNLDQAVKWWHDAADLGNAYAEAQMADCYFYGLGVEKNLDKAVEYLTRAADKNVPGAQYRLGILYYTGQGVQQDLVHSELLIKKARDGGMQEAQDFLDKQFKK